MLERWCSTLSLSFRISKGCFFLTPFLRTFFYYCCMLHIASRHVVHSTNFSTYYILLLLTVPMLGQLLPPSRTGNNCKGELHNQIADVLVEGQLQAPIHWSVWYKVVVLDLLYVSYAGSKDPRCEFQVFVTLSTCLVMLVCYLNKGFKAFSTKKLRVLPSAIL